MGIKLAYIVLGKGNAKVKLFDVKGNLHEVMLSNALYVPSYLQKHLFSFCRSRKGRQCQLKAPGKYLHH